MQYRQLNHEKSRSSSMATTRTETTRRSTYSRARVVGATALLSSVVDTVMCCLTNSSCAGCHLSLTPTSVLSGYTAMVASNGYSDGG